MYRYHRILYRRLLRGQSSDELLRLRDQSALFPSLARLIDEEVVRRGETISLPIESTSPKIRMLTAPRSAWLRQ
jgi:hypothetical protein